MTEHNIFCFSKAYEDYKSFQQARYRAFNKEVGKEKYNEIVEEVKEILTHNKGENLEYFWKSVTQEQWTKLLNIPEAKDFKEGFEYISGQKINLNLIEVKANGKTVYISKESANALGLV